WASSTVTPPATQSVVNQELFRLLFGGTYPTIGEAVAAAKRVVDNHDLRRSWIFFGDPAMHLAGEPTQPPTPPTPPPTPDPAPQPPTDTPSSGPTPDQGTPASGATPTPTSAADLPDAPMGLASSVSGSTVTLSWVAAASGAAPASYVIEAGSFSGGRDFAQSTGSLATSFLATNVSNGTYFVRVPAANAPGTGAPSHQLLLIVRPAPP